jgi:Predicted membrane protein
MIGDVLSAKGDALLPYEKFLSRDFILRDWLAVDRTILANERTLLSYTRTALTLILAGLTFIRFFGPQLWAALGYVSLAAGLVIWGIGLQRYLGKLQHYQAYVQEERGERSEQKVQTH